MGRCRVYVGAVLVAVAMLLCAGQPAWAEGPVAFTRKTYDLIILWVNFLILTGLIVKFVRQPIIGFLKDKRAEVRQTIQDLEDRKRGIEERIRETQIELDAGQERLALLKEKIIAEGQRRKETLIEEARNESALMMASARLKMDAMVRDAGDRIRNDLIDMAAEMAREKLPLVITDQDHEKLLQNWMNFCEP
jgi:F-type H+-transporting ATPase subunit b